MPLKAGKSFLSFRLDISCLATWGVSAQALNLGVPSVVWLFPGEASGTPCVKASKVWCCDRSYCRFFFAVIRLPRGTHWDLEHVFDKWGRIANRNERSIRIFVYLRNRFIESCTANCSNISQIFATNPLNGGGSYVCTFVSQQPT